MGDNGKDKRSYKLENKPEATWHNPVLLLQQLLHQHMLLQMYHKAHCDSAEGGVPAGRPVLGQVGASLSSEWVEVGREKCSSAGGGGKG